MRKFLLLLSLCFTVLLFTFTYSIKAWTLDDDLETFSVTEENPPLPTQVFLPMISGNQATNSTAVGSSDTTWTRYEATYYSFLYPDERKVEEQNGGQYIHLSPSTDQKTDSKIEFAYLGFEIGEDEDLLEWYDNYTKAGIGEVPERIILEKKSITAPDGSIVRKLHEQHGVDDRVTQTILLTHGNLVLSINTYSNSDVITTLLKTIADSIEFYPTSPKNFDDLFPVSPPTVRTFEQFQDLIKPPADIVIAPATIGTKEETPVGMPIPPSVPHSDEFIEWERIYKELIDSGKIPRDTSDSESAVRAAGQVTEDRQALPPEFRSPVNSNVNAKCDSTAHSGRSAYAIDIGVGTGTDVVSVNDGTVGFSGWQTDWGNLIRIYSDVVAGGGTRRYWHNYAHLNVRDVSAGANVNFGQSIADSGNTGNSTGPHLHFHMTRDVNFNDGYQPAVDLSPIGGFRPNLNYPVSGDCGVTESPATDPIIIEPVAYTTAYQPRSDHSWNCSTWYMNQHTTECYMAVVPLTNWGIDPLVIAQSPELRYGRVRSYWASNYYIWLCGRGGSLDDDSVYMGVNDASPSSAQRITGYDQSVWVWKSIKMDGQRPYMYLPGNLPVVNLWAREDGMRVDRILLTRDVNYNPTGNIRCGGY